jgi:hypothetical protein
MMMRFKKDKLTTALTLAALALGMGNPAGASSKHPSGFYAGVQGGYSSI